MKNKMAAKAQMPMEQEMPGHAMDDSEAESHLHMLMEGHKIKQDPAKMGAIRKLAGRHKKMLEDIIGTDVAPVSEDNLQGYGPAADSIKKAAKRRFPKGY